MYLILISLIHVFVCERARKKEKSVCVHIVCGEVRGQQRSVLCIMWVSRVSLRPSDFVIGRLPMGSECLSSFPKCGWYSEGNSEMQGDTLCPTPDRPQRVGEHLLSFALRWVFICFCFLFLTPGVFGFVTVFVSQPGLKFLAQSLNAGIKGATIPGLLRYSWWDSPK